MPHDSRPYDFFVSYARRDNSRGWVTSFVEAILEEYKTFGKPAPTYFFDTGEIHPGQDWRDRILRGVADSRVFLAFISPHYLASEWCRREWSAWMDAEIAAHVLADDAIPLYIVDVPGFENHKLSPEKIAGEVARRCELPPAAHAEILAGAPQTIRQLRYRQFVNVQSLYQKGPEALRREPNGAVVQEEVRRTVAGVTRSLDASVERARSAAESANTVPFPNTRFTGRVAELRDLRERLQNNQTSAVCGVHGLGGIGKTELAYAYSYKYAWAYTGGRLLVRCDGKSTLREAALSLDDFADFHDAISDEERKIPDRLFAAVSRCLSRRLREKGPVLLVLDNVTHRALFTAQETGELTRLSSQLHLLMTTRLDPPAVGNWLTLGQLPEADAMQLLEKHRAFADDVEREAAQSIVKRLDGFALAVELVAAWLAEHAGSSYRALAATIGLEDLETMAGDERVALHTHQERRLTAVLGPVLASLGDVERRVMEMAAFLPPDTVALPWLKALVEQDLPNALEPTRLISDPWAEICSHLTRLALFSRAGVVESWRVRVHRLVQDLLKRAMASERSASCQGAVRALVIARDAELETTTMWESARWEIEPLDALANLWADGGHADASWLLNQVGQRLDDLAEWARAEPLMRRALKIDEASYGPDHPDVAIELNNLAQLLQETNRLSEAEPLMRRALKIDEDSYGANDPEVAIDLNNLALLLEATNRLSEAEPLMRRALEIDEASYGPHRPEVAKDLNKLAGLLRRTNRFGEAEPLIRRALEIDEASYDADHPDVAVDLNNLAQLLKATNRLSEAEPLMRRALGIDEARYGADHPNVATRLNSLATLILATNRLGEAEPLMRRALKIDEASHGADHPDVARDLNSLARLLQQANRLGDAEPLMRRALEIGLAFTRSTQHEHPRLRSRLASYVDLLRAMNVSSTEILDKLGSMGPELTAIYLQQTGDPK
jgi:tetratricopeptide (TPR) repeat protein